MRTAEPDHPPSNGSYEGATCERPHNWDKAVSCAYLRMLDFKQSRSTVAKTVGIGMRTLQRWEASAWWPRAQLEASTRWCSGLLAASCTAVTRAVESGDAATARWALERLMPNMAAPTQRLEHSGPDGEPLEVRATIVQYPVNGRDKPPEGES